jgi:hypothetical protein
MGRNLSKTAPMHFKTMVQSDVPQGRNGKHKQIVTTILKDLDGLKASSALKVPLADLADSKEKVRSALNRATRKAGPEGTLLSRMVAACQSGRRALLTKERKKSGRPLFSLA